MVDMRPVEGDEDAAVLALSSVPVEDSAAHGGIGGLDLAALLAWHTAVDWAGERQCIYSREPLGRLTSPEHTNFQMITIDTIYLRLGGAVIQYPQGHIYLRGELDTLWPGLAMPKDSLKIVPWGVLPACPERGINALYESKRVVTEGERAMVSTKPEHFTVYDFTRQAWVQLGRYVRCGHESACRCYGREHAGELAVVHTTANCQNMSRGIHVEADCRAEQAAVRTGIAGVAAGRMIHTTDDRGRPIRWAG